jgi:hypothetical protein
MSARKMPSQWKIKKHSNLFREKTEWRKSNRLFPPFFVLAQLVSGVSLAKDFLMRHYPASLVVSTYLFYA